MTDPVQSPHSNVTTTSGALARYDAKQRGLATQSGGPVARSTVGTLSSHISHVVCTTSDDRVVVVDVSDHHPVEPATILTPERLHSMLVDAYCLGESDPDGERPASKPFAFADRDTFKRVLRRTKALADARQTTEDRQVHRLLAYRADFPLSAVTPVLTDALSTRYWLPSGGSATDLSAWATAFGFPAPWPSPATLTPLIKRASGWGASPKTLGAAVKSEITGTSYARYGSSHSACQAFRNAETATNAYGSLLACDPLLRERNVVAGVVTRIRVHQIKDKTIEAYLDSPGKVREGGRMLVFDGYEGGGAVELAVREVVFRDDRFMAVFGRPTERNANNYLIPEAKKANRPLFATSAPFLMVSKPGTRRRWTGGDEEPNVVDVPEIPVDIVLAGGPVEV